MHSKPCICAYLTLSLVATFNVSFSQNLRIGWSALNPGFAVPTFGNVSVASAVGQELIGNSSHANNMVTAGFLGNPLFREIFSGVDDVEHGVPLAYALSQNYPNPFNPSTVIRFHLPVSGLARLSVFNMLGQEVARLVDGVEQAGVTTIEWSGMNVPSGVYMYRLQAGRFTVTKKMMLIR